MGEPRPAPPSGTRALDARFLLPVAAGRVRFLGDVGVWARLPELGWTVAEDGSAADLVVSDAAHVREASASPAPCVVLVGRSGGAVDWRGRHATPYLERPGPQGPSLFVPLDQPRAVRYVWRRWSTPVLRRQRLRNAVLPSLAPVLARRARLTVASAHPPFLVGRTGEDLVPGGCSWFLALGTGDELQRATFQVLPPGEDAPAWVVRFSRVPGNREPFERDRAGLDLLARHAPRAAGRAPRVRGELDVDGVVAVVETAAPGRHLGQHLLSTRPLRARVRAVDEVCAWLVDLAIESRVPPEELRPEIERLESQVVAPWVGNGVAAGLASALPPVPGVLLHADPGPWNITWSEHGVCVLDWESARHPGLPLWDLVYFLADALVSVEGVIDEDTKLREALRLLRGQHRHSARAFRWVRALVDGLGIPPDAVGPIITLCWLHHGVSARQRAARLAAGAPTADEPHLGRVAEPWLRDPELGTTWSSWRSTG